MPHQRRYHFDRFQLDLGTGQLLGPAGPVPLTPKALAVLEYFVERPGLLVGKDELIEAVWPGVFVGDSALKVCVREIRRALDDDAKSPRVIETAHRRGYRFIAPVRAETPIRLTSAAGTGTSGASTRPSVRETIGHDSIGEKADPAYTETAGQTSGPTHAPDLPVRYARSGEVNIAYQVLGSGPIDLLFVMGWVSHLEYFWNEPSFARFLRRLARFSRLIVFDKRGTGLSDRVADLPTLEQRMDDVRAVLDAVGSRRAVLLGVSEGGPMCSLFAATHPDKTEALIMIGTYARRIRTPDYPWAPTSEEREAFCREILEGWGGPVGVETRAPSMAHDPAFRQWWATYLRMGASPAAAVALTRMNAQIDVRHVLPTIQVPTLVMHRTGDRCLHVEEGRYVAGLIPGARYVELRGDDHLPFVGDQEAVVDEIERFLRGTERRSEASQVLATILCVDSHHSQALAESDVARLRDIAAAQAQRFGGRSVACSGRHVFVAFDGPARAIRCGCAIAEESRQLDLSPGIGLHTGECDLLAGTDNGLVSKIATRVASLARAGDVLVSRTVVDLVAGSGLRFDDRGMHALAETERPWRVFAVRSEHGETDVSASPPAAGGRAARLLVHPTRLTRHGRG